MENTTGKDRQFSFLFWMSIFHTVFWIITIHTDMFKMKLPGAIMLTVCVLAVSSTVHVPIASLILFAKKDFSAKYLYLALASLSATYLFLIGIHY